MLIWSLFFLFTLKLSQAISRSDFGSGFALLPQDSDWSKLVKNSTSTEIQEVVSIYMKPYQEYQEAARNRTITPKQLKKAFVAATFLLQESSKNLSITSEEFQSAKEDINAYLVMSTAAFKLKKAKDLAPVFNIETIEAFAMQRLKHLIGANASNYLSYLMRKNSYENSLHEWNMIGSRLPACKYRGMMPRNLDLAYVEHTIAVYLDVMRLRNKADMDEKLPRPLRFLAKLRRDKIVQNIQTLGNGYSTSKPPYSSFLIVVCTFYALLFTVMF